MRRPLALSFLIALAWSGAAAEEKFRQLDSHAHGHGKLNIAVDGKVIEMELEVPGADIVGFEHKPGNAEDKAAIQNALTTLRSGETLFVFSSGAGCELENASAKFITEENEPGHGHGHGHGHNARKAKDDEETHAEFYVRYRFGCADPDQITKVTFPYFGAFPNSEELEVQMISRSGTMGFEVDRGAPVLNITN